MAGHRTSVAIVGAGHVGLALARMLAETGDYAVRIADCTEEACLRAAANGLEVHRLDASSTTQLSAFLDGVGIVVAAVPDRIVGRVAIAARERNLDYLDFSKMDEAMAAMAGVPDGPVFLPACGVSPGITDDVVSHLARTVEGPIDVEIAVGAIPVRRSNRLGYSLIWNLDGLFSEYTLPSKAIENFKVVEVPPLSNLVSVTIDGKEYEAFCTDGVMGSVSAFADTRVRTLTCRTIRYAGHLDYMLLLLDDLRLRHRRDLLHTILKNGLPDAEQDMVLIHASARGADGQAAGGLTMRIEADQGRGSSLAVASAAHTAFLIDEISSGRNVRPTTDSDLLSGLLRSRFAVGLVHVEEFR
jgi:saccharopine dehydrogenase-like NADP-dependent oxidoreductase